MSDRTDFVAALRSLADHYERTEQALPYSQLRLDIIENEPSGFAREVRLLGGNRTKKASDALYRVGRDFGPIRLEVIASRGNVCEAVVVGTESYIEHEVVETRPVQRTRDLIEWRCAPVLSEVDG